MAWFGIGGGGAMNCREASAARAVAEGLGNDAPKYSEHAYARNTS